MPEFVNYTLNALCNLAPTEPSAKFGAFPYRKSQEERHESGEEGDLQLLLCLRIRR
jgi:hypothetical protein